MSDNFLFIHVNEWAAIDSPDAIPISSGYILATLKQHGFSGHILGDYKDSPLSPATITAAIQELQPLALGFSVYEENINRVRMLASFAKYIKKDLPVILGGPQITFIPSKALLQMPEVDILCRAEGEVVMPDLAEALADGKDIDNVPGITWCKDGTVIDVSARSGAEHLDDYPSPYLSETINPAGKPRIMLFTSRGCTSPCTFCYTTRASGRKIRFHSIQRTIDEMVFLKKKGIQDFWFADPNFAYSRKRLVQLLEAIIEQVPGTRFWCQTRYNLVDRDLLSLLKKAGAHTIAFGLESANPETLKTINKGLDPDRMSKAIELAKKEGLNVELFTQFGLPGETLKGSKQTLEFVKANGVTIEGNSISQQMHLFFGAPVAEEPAKHGIKPHKITRPAYQSICRDFRTDSMSAEDIKRMSIIWRLNRTDFQQDIKNSRNLFSIAGFISANKKILTDCPDADMILTKIYLALDEPQAAVDCLKRLQNNVTNTDTIQQFTEQSLISFKTKRRAKAATGCKIIFDCKGMIDGHVIPETICCYQQAVLGSNNLVPDFENGLNGVKAGSATQFEVVFPVDYANRKLAGVKVLFQAFLYQVLEPVIYESLEDMRENAKRNMYRFDDLYNLKNYNENLYYMVLRDSVLHNYTGNLTDSVALFSYYLKLGFKEEAMKIAYSLPDDPSILGHVGKILLVNNHPDEALYFLDRVAGTSGEMENERIKAYIQLADYQKAEEISSQPLLSTNLETMNYQVMLASFMGMPIQKYIQRMNRLLNAHVKMMAAEAVKKRGTKTLC